MPPLTVDPNLGAGKFLSGDYHPNISAEHETLVANAGALKDGTVMAKFTAGGNIGKVDNWDPAGTNGQQTPIGILHGDHANSTAAKRVVVVERDQLVNGWFLVYAAAATAPEKAAAEASLKAAGIIVRR